MGTSRFFAAALSAVLALSPLAASAAYHHEGEDDAPNFLEAYPSKAGTKLDNCNLCHRGGTASNGSTYGSCQWCHYSYGYEEPHGEIADTLNPYGLAYLGAGGGGAGTAALTSIESVDSDGDTFSNIDRPGVSGPTTTTRSRRTTTPASARRRRPSSRSSRSRKAPPTSTSSRRAGATSIRRRS